MKTSIECINEGKLKPEDYKCPFCGSKMKQIERNGVTVIKCNWGLCKSRKHEILWNTKGEPFTLTAMDKAIPKIVGSESYFQELNTSDTIIYNFILFRIRVSRCKVHNYNGKYLGTKTSYSLA